MASRRTSSRGLGRRLLLAFFGISAFSALVAAAAIYAFFEVGHSLTLIDRRIDPILASLEVSRSVERIVAGSAALSAATNETHRGHVFTRLSREANRLQALLDALRDGGIGNRTLAPIEGNAVQLGANLTALNADVQLRLQLRDRIKGVMRGVFDGNDETQRLLSPTLLVYDSQIARLGSMIGTDGKSADFPVETARPLIAGLLAERSVQRVQQQIAEAADDLAQAAATEQQQRLVILAFQLRRTIGDLETGSGVLGPKLRPLFLAEVEKFKAFVDGPDSIPQLHQHELALMADAEKLLAENTALSRALTAAAERLVEATKREIRTATGAAVLVQRRSTQAIAALVVLSLLSSILIVWRYVGRNIVARLDLLSGAMFAIAGGSRDMAVPVTGSDEIAAMGRAVEVFRQNAIERDALLVERADAAERLERQVAERTAELSEALEQQTAIGGMLEVISRSTFDLQPVLETLGETAARLCQADIAFVSRREGDAFRVVTAVGSMLEARHDAPRFQKLHLDAAPVVPGRENITGRLVSKGRAVQIADTLAEPEFKFSELTATAKLRTLLGVPLLREGSVAGTMTLGRRQVEPFTEKQVALVATFADQAVIAIENARLLGELRERQAELRVTFDNMGDAVAMFDAERRLAAWNRNFQQLLQLPDAFLAERPSFARYFAYLGARGEYGSADVEAELRRFVDDTGEEIRFERMRPDGRVVEVRRNAVPGGGFVLIYGDITERKRAEAEIRAARDTAETTLGELKQAQANLIQAEKMASLGQLTAGIAHEIRNPLNFVNNFAGLSVELLDELKEAAAAMIAGRGDERRAEIDEIVTILTGNLEKIAEHGRRADGIVQSMLAHSRGGTGERREVDLNQLADEALNLAYHGARARDQGFNIGLERDFEAGLAPIALVPQDLTRVLLNLFGNGFYAARKKGAADPGFRPLLRVATRDLGGAVEIRVRDNGTGIAPEIRDKLFQPFVTTKPTGEGTGLGLSISWDIVTQQHGGTIAVDSEPGEFTEFTIRLPHRSRSAGAA